MENENDDLNEAEYMMHPDKVNLILIAILGTIFFIFIALMLIFPPNKQNKQRTPGEQFPIQNPAS